MSDLNFADAGPYDDNPEYRETPKSASHEYTDANVWIIVKFALWLALSAVIVHVGMYFAYAYSVERREVTEFEYPLAVGEERRLPAQPRLQAIPLREGYEFRQQEAAQQHGYGWLDRNAGTVRLPIDQAMKLTVERGLPSRATAPDGQPAAAPGLMPADSSSGRTLERRRQ
jgi:hypothetical protein